MLAFQAGRRGFESRPPLYQGTGNDSGAFLLSGAWVGSGRTRAEESRHGERENAKERRREEDGREAGCQPAGEPPAGRFGVDRAADRGRGGAGGAALAADGW